MWQSEQRAARLIQYRIPNPNSTDDFREGEKYTFSGAMLAPGENDLNCDEFFASGEKFDNDEWIVSTDGLPTAMMVCFCHEDKVPKKLQKLKTILSNLVQLPTPFNPTEFVKAYKDGDKTMIQRLKTTRSAWITVGGTVGVSVSGVPPYGWIVCLVSLFACAMNSCLLNMRERKLDQLHFDEIVRMLQLSLNMFQNVNMFERTRNDDVLFNDIKNGHSLDEQNLLAALRTRYYDIFPLQSPWYSRLFHQPEKKVVSE